MTLKHQCSTGIISGQVPVSKNDPGVIAEVGSSMVYSPELCSIPGAGFLIALSAVPKVRRVCLLMALRLERGGFYSRTAREIMRRRYGVTIGAYSYGGCFRPGMFPPGVTIGRYVSIAEGISVLRRNHPLDRLSTHPFFFNHRLGFVKTDHTGFRPLAVEHDAWIGERAIITPGCQRIGVGAVIGAGAVVTKDVEDFAIAGGNPARLIRFRFDESLRKRVLESKWWESSSLTCANVIESMLQPLEGCLSVHPLLSRASYRREEMVSSAS